MSSGGGLTTSTVAPSVFPVLGKEIDRKERRIDVSMAVARDIKVFLYCSPQTFVMNVGCAAAVCGMREGAGDGSGRTRALKVVMLRRNPPDVGVTSGQKPCTKTIYIVLQTSVGLF